MALEPGYLVSKHVRLVRKLKGGGMGSVWVADHLALGTQVAVKFISGDHVGNPELTARFKREATSAARIKSPHVVQIHDHGVTDDGLPYMVMELLEGEDLSTRLKRRGPMSVDDVVTIVEQTCRVLMKSHRLGVIHRDIKPANLFLVEADGAIFVKLLDFGVAKLGAEASDLTNTGAMVGTIAYMSPEQLLDARNVDHRADLWSLAVVAYRALTGQQPFKDDNGLGALVLSVDRGQFAQASSLVPGIPESVDPWFARAFMRQADARFANAKDMANDLALALGRKLPLEEQPSERETIPDRPVDKPTPVSHTKIGLNAPPKNDASPKKEPPRVARDSRASALEDPGTVGGLSTAPVKKRGPLLTRALITVAVVAVVVMGGELALTHLRGSPEVAASSTSVSAPSANGTAAPTTEAAAASSSEAPADAPTATAIASEAATASTSAAPIESPVEASAEPVPSASVRAPSRAPAGRVPIGGGARTEKDYGF
jgi:serine/threonine-protein kinase